MFGYTEMFSYKAGHEPLSMRVFLPHTHTHTHTDKLVLYSSLMYNPSTQKKQTKNQANIVETPHGAFSL